MSDHAQPTAARPTGAQPAAIHPLILARHGRTALNADGKLRGHLDPPLDAIGRHEAAVLATAMATFAPIRVASSPLRRAVETGHAVAAAGHLGVITEPGLIDRDYGRWAGCRESDVIAEWGSLDQAPGVEPVRRLVARARRALDQQRRWLRLGAVVLVAHDAVNSALLSSLDSSLGEQADIQQRTGCWNLLRSAAGSGWLVELVDQKTAH